MIKPEDVKTEISEIVFSEAGTKHYKVTAQYGAHTYTDFTETRDEAEATVESMRNQMVQQYTPVPVDSSFVKAIAKKAKASSFKM